jgi:hypothetical protein
MFEINLFLDTWCYQAQISNSIAYLVTLLNNILVKLFKWMIRGPWCNKAQIFHSKHAYLVMLSNILLLFKYMNKISFLFLKIDWSNLATLFGIHNYNRRVLWHHVIWHGKVQIKVLKKVFAKEMNMASLVPIYHGHHILKREICIQIIKPW